MITPLNLRIAFTTTVKHIKTVTNKVRVSSGPGRTFTAPDSHKIAEGLFLSAVAHWEEFCQALLMSDLALLSSSTLRKNIRSFKSNAARDRITEMIMNHLDHPNGFYDWSDFSKVHSRAISLLGVPNRFNVAVRPVSSRTTQKNQSSLSGLSADLTDFKVIRNSIAHKNNKAWDAFIRLIKRPPYNLTPAQRKGITPGRLVIAHNNGADPILIYTLNKLEEAAFILVPRV
jgi:hypothetical protein